MSAISSDEKLLSTTAIAVLIDELRSDDAKKRINSVKQLPAVANALGAEKVRSELVPFLSEFTDDDDEILVALAEALGMFIDYVGGPANSLCLLKPLEPLACAEESLVRDKAIESLKKVIAVAKIKDHESEIIDLLKRLSKDTDCFTGKIAAAALAPVCFSHVNSTNQQDLILYFFHFLFIDYIVHLEKMKICKSEKRLPRI